MDPFLPLLAAAVTSAVVALPSAPVVPAARSAPSPAPPLSAVGATAPSGGRIPVGQGAWPLSPQPQVVRGFDPPDSPWGRGHRGVDLAGRSGQVVSSALAGRVTFAGVIAGRGVVVVDHGGVRTTYEPVTAGVRVGQRVGRGGPIGMLQSSGSHCAPRVCLHWGLLRDETYLNPLMLVGGVPVRLLPQGP